MEQTFRNQTTKLVTAFPFKGSGLVNDRLRLDTSGLAANTEYVLSYDTTTGTFAWSTPADVSGLDTLYSANGTIDEQRVVTIESPNSLQFGNAADTAYFLFQPDNATDLYNTLISHYREGVNGYARIEMLSGAPNVILSLGNEAGDIEADPEDPTTYFAQDREVTLELADTTFNVSVVETGLVNNEGTVKHIDIDLAFDNLSIETRELIDTTNSQNTYLYRGIGDIDNFGLYRYYDPTINSYVTDNFLGDCNLEFSDASILLQHTRHGAGDGATISLQSEHVEQAITRLTLDTDMTVPFLTRTDSNVAIVSHEITLASDNFTIQKRATVDTEGPYIDLIVTNEDSVNTSMGIGQTSSDGLSSSSYAYIQVVNVDGSLLTDFSVSETNATLNVTGTPTTPAILELNSTAQGFLPPRMTSAERDAIVAPVAGLLIYNTTTSKLNVYTTAWEQVTSA